MRRSAYRRGVTKEARGSEVVVRSFGGCKVQVPFVGVTVVRRLRGRGCSKRDRDGVQGTGGIAGVRRGRGLVGMRRFAVCGLM